LVPQEIRENQIDDFADPVILAGAGLSSLKPQNPSVPKIHETECFDRNRRIRAYRFAERGNNHFN
jgi:hypothetical protein